MFKLEKNPLTEDLNAFESQVKESNEPLPPTGSQSWLICGKPGTGKSTLLLRAITSSKSNWCACKNFDLVFLCSPSAKHDPKFNDLVSELTEDGRYFDSFDEKVLDEIMDRIEGFNHQNKKDLQEYNETKKGNEKGFYSREVGQDKKGKPIIKKIDEKPLLPRHLLILDDVVNDLPKSTQKSKINALYCNHRHKKLCIITVSQIYNKLNPIIRRGANMISVFRTDNKTEYDALERDLSVGDNFKKIYDFATDKLNSFLHIQLCGARPHYFKKFDKIIF